MDVKYLILKTWNIFLLFMKNETEMKMKLKLPIVMVAYTNTCSI